MGVSSLLCLLPALLATASAQAGTLTCDVCFGPTAACDMFQTTCQDDRATGGCLSVAEETSLGGRKDASFRKQCLSSDKRYIKSPISFTVGVDQYVRHNVRQCNDTNKCNSATFQVTKNNTLNGLQCPTCFALNFAACNSQVTPCTGEETYCIDFKGNLVQGTSSSPFEAKGCASASAREIKPGGNLTVAIYKFDFYWGSSGPATPIPTSPSIATTTPPPPTTTTTPPPPTTTRTPPPPTTTRTPPPPTHTIPPPANATNPPANTTQNIPLPPVTSTTKGGSPALGKVSFALYLPGLMGLLLVKLLY